ncbi:hypothetical protein CMV_026728 [Castanea mollissima]|uniref:Uncharacterized protein n=1 Tax=Castanea mollissima TaxID=60419 RepID=A0A8J4QGN5_9ROSI|nr:hypothetical protein CMV_026728 [Castanea mollissima]
MLPLVFSLPDEVFVKSSVNKHLALVVIQSELWWGFISDYDKWVPPSFCFPLQPYHHSYAFEDLLAAQIGHHLFSLATEVS